MVDWFFIIIAFLTLILFLLLLYIGISCSRQHHSKSEPPISNGTYNYDLVHQNIYTIKGTADDANVNLRLSTATLSSGPATATVSGDLEVVSIPDLNAFKNTTTTIHLNGLEQLKGLDVVFITAETINFRSLLTNKDVITVRSIY